jgi:hypothetical protein
MNIELNKDVTLTSVDTGILGAQSTSASIQSGSANSVSNCTIGYWPNYYIPYYNTYPVSDLQTRKVANGFVVIKGTEEFVFLNSKSLAKFITDHYNKKDKK